MSFFPLERLNESNLSSFEEHHFEISMKLSSCMVCGTPCIGQVYYCQNCKASVHKDCAQNVHFCCCKKDINEVIPNDQFKHQFVKNFHTITIPDVCCCCHEVILKDNYCCKLCGLFVHQDCIKLVKQSCRMFCCEHDNHWLIPIFNISSFTCSVCGNVIPKPHYTCNICHVNVCACCVNKLPANCYFGPLKKYYVSPSSVVKTEKWYKIIPNEDCLPAIFFINTKSGNQLGDFVFNSLSERFNPLQVYNILEGFDNIWEFAKDLGDNFVAVACGGDGTVGWVMNKLHEVNLKPVIHVIPIGTGNDMARSLQWGGGYDGEDIFEVLRPMAHAPIVKMDRWLITGSEEEHIFSNYFSIGIDAEIALSFHQKRNANPEKFKSRIGNKLQYVLCSYPQITKITDLCSSITLMIDGTVIDIPKVQGIAILNLPSYGGGNRFWGQLKLKEIMMGLKETNYNDKVLEVVGFENAVHLGSCVSRTSVPLKIAQGKVIIIMFKEDIAAQYDGEPYIQKKGEIKISLHEQVNMYCRNPFPF